jgi:dihydroorotate dehydrogenase (fumarate)
MNVNLRTRYLGLDLENPLVVSACPLTGDLNLLKQFAEAGAAAVVLPSLFEEQIEHEAWELHRLQTFRADSFPESLSYFPEIENYNAVPREYLRLVEGAKKAVNIPVIGSLNGTSRGGWVRYAARIQDAGADALELNVYFIPTNPDMTGGSVEEQYIELVAEVRAAISIPLAVKVGPYFSSLPNMAKHLVKAGADGLVLFNRFLQPDVNLETLEVEPRLVLSSRDELRLPLRWIAILREHVSASLAATSGVHLAEDVLKLLFAGADATMLASAFFRHGPGYCRTLLDEVAHWLEHKGYQSVEQMKGSISRQNSPHPEAFERANYMKALVSFSSDQV